MICGNCKARTDDKQEVKDCFKYGRGVHQVGSDPYGTRPLLQSVPAPVTREPEPSSVYTPPQRYERPKPPPLKFPLEMLEGVDNGYYAARLDDNDPYRFFRVSRPKSGKYAGCIKVQTLHSEKLDTFLIRYRSDKHYIVPHRRADYEEPFIVVIADQKHCAQKFGEEIGRCCRCYKQLTDDRSLYYGIGPECEKYWPHILDMVDEEKGEYAGPSGISA